MAGIMASVEDRIRRLVARDFGLEPRVHPLLDPGVPAPALEADPVPPVDPSMVTWPMDATREVRVGDRLIGYESGGMVHVTDRNAWRALQRGLPLEVSIRPLPEPEWDVAAEWLGREAVRAAVPVVSPDCRDENHHKCTGDAWDLAADMPVSCGCLCH
jgi:hypothetical protein